jgi:hypothetical protein
MRNRSRIVKGKNRWPKEFLGYTPPQTLSEWRRDMTICIAAICNENTTIVAAFDHMLSSSWISADSIGGFKFIPLGGTWGAMVAADDVTEAEPITEKVKQRMTQERRSIAQMESLFKDAYVSERQSRAESQILGVYGLTMDRFVSKGYKEMGGRVFYELCTQIQKVRLSCQFLIVGFDDKYKPQLSVIDDTGIASRFTKIGFAAIGCGAPNALGNLYLHEYQKRFSPDLAVYLVSEAKFMAESAPGVGKKTTIIKMNSTPDGDVSYHGRVTSCTDQKGMGREGQAQTPEGY